MKKRLVVNVKLINNSLTLGIGYTRASCGTHWRIRGVSDGIQAWSLLCTCGNIVSYEGGGDNVLVSILRPSLFDLDMNICSGGSGGLCRREYLGGLVETW
jgi:hypothetical protein